MIDKYFHLYGRKNDVVFEEIPKPEEIPLAELDTTNDFAKWIPCSERLPDEVGTYIVTDEDGDVYEYDYCDLTVHVGRWSFGRRKIIAWMPLPEPFKKEPEANDRQCEKCRHKVETKPGVEACDVWDCSFEPKDEQS